MADHVPAKSTLFCPRCDHASRVEGDWLVVEAAAGERYVCPVCDATVTRRPGFRDVDEAGPLSAWTRCWRTWVRALATWRRASCEAVTET